MPPAPVASPFCFPEEARNCGSRGPVRVRSLAGFAAALWFVRPQANGFTGRGRNRPFAALSPCPPHGSQRAALPHCGSHGSKDGAFRKLTDPLQGEISSSLLHRAVAPYEITGRTCVSAWKHLRMSHARAVLGLPTKEQERILGTADDEAWTVEQIEQEVATTRKDVATRAQRCRRPLAALQKAMREDHTTCPGWWDISSVAEDALEKITVAGGGDGRTCAESRSTGSDPDAATQLDPDGVTSKEPEATPQWFHAKSRAVVQTPTRDGP